MYIDYIPYDLAGVPETEIVDELNDQYVTDDKRIGIKRNNREL